MIQKIPPCVDLGAWCKTPSVRLAAGPLLAASLAVCLGLVLPQTAALADSYRVTVSGNRPETIHVEASLALAASLAEPMIGLLITRSNDLPNGQADLVRNLSILDASGKQIAAEPVAGGDWRLSGAGAGDRISVSYDIALEHGKYHWGPGIDEVAYTTDDGLFFTGFSLFMVTGEMSDEVIEVDFSLPAGWIASTPWTKERDTYHARGTMDLLRNCFFLGTHSEETVSIGKFQFVMAIGNDLADSRDLFIDEMKPLLPAFLETFGGLPNETHFLVVLNRSDQSDGGAFLGSYSMLLAGEVDKTSSVVWGHGIAHELFHFWNGHTVFPSSRSDEEWFKEGFTDYYTILHRSRAGLDTRQNTYRKLENSARRYILSKRLMGFQDSLRQAGADKHRKRFLVYGGGTVIALALDVELRQATENQKSLDDLMHQMYEEFGRSGKGYSYEDIVRISSGIAGKDLSPFFDRYVAGSEMLDIAPSFEAMGLRLDTAMDEFYLTTADRTSTLQEQIRHSILGF